MYFPVDSYKTEQLQFSVGVIKKKKKGNTKIKFPPYSHKISIRLYFLVWA